MYASQHGLQAAASQVLVGGVLGKHASGGQFYQPTVLVGVTSDMRIWRWALLSVHDAHPAPSSACLGAAPASWPANAHYSSLFVMSSCSVCGTVSSLYRAAAHSCPAACMSMQSPRLLCSLYIWRTAAAGIQLVLTGVRVPSTLTCCVCSVQGGGVWPCACGGRGEK